MSIEPLYISTIALVKGFRRSNYELKEFIIKIYGACKCVLILLVVLVTRVSTNDESRQNYSDGKVLFLCHNIGWTDARARTHAGTYVCVYATMAAPGSSAWC